VLDALRARCPDAAAWAVVDAVTEAASSRAPAAPNVDWALGSLVFVAGLAPDSGEAMFSLARVAGWLAHVIEEYEAPALRYRVTSVTSGPA
jgi:citrate synthase